MILSSGSRVKVALVAVLALVLAGGDLFSDLRDSRRAGSQPVEMTLAEAKAASAQSPFIRRWIRITEPVELQCDQILEQSADGKVTVLTVLAFDQSKEQPLLLAYPGGARSCEQLKSIPLEGMLAEPATKYWTTNGKTLPVTPNRLIGLTVGDTPKGIMQEAWVLSVVVLVSIGLLVFAAVSGPKKLPVPPSKPAGQKGRAPK